MHDQAVGAAGVEGSYHAGAGSDVARTRPGEQAGKVGGMTTARQPTRIDVQAGPVRLSALDYGSVGRPAPEERAVVLLHGMSDMAWSMDTLAQALAPRYRCVAFDLRGHGHSDQPGAYSMLHFVADLEAALAELQIRRPILVGHSLGGHVASYHAGLYPEDCTALIVLEGMGPPAHMATEDPDARAAQLRAHIEVLRTPMRHKPLRDLDAATERLRATHPRLDHDRARFLAREGTVAGPEGGLVWRFDLRSRDWIASVDHGRSEEVWRRVTCPVLVVTGAESWDTWWTRRALPTAGMERTRLSDDEWQERLGCFADHEWVELTEAGHLVQFDQPTRLNQVVVDFVERRVR